jgi:tetratricopeptide (TPR) repeat protein
MISLCRKYYETDEHEQKKIDEFERDYTPDKAAFWYTKDSFVYRLLNAALRTDDIDLLFKFRFFIRDLFLQLNELYQSSTKIDTNVITVYRGQHVKPQELHYLKENLHGLISMNTFVSTTNDTFLAFVFSGEGLERPLLESVVFQIKIDPSIFNDKDGEPFARLQASAIKSENELLISMGAVFRIESINSDLFDGICYIQLTMCCKPNELLDYYRAELNRVGDNETGSGLLALGGFLSEMADYKRAEHYYRMLLDELPFEHHDVCFVHNNLGYLHATQGQLETAVECYQRALSSLEDHVPWHHRNFAPILNNLGSAYWELDRTDEALTIYERALNIYRAPHNVESTDPRMAATLYNNVGTIYLRREDFVRAANNFMAATALENILPSNHPTLATSYNNLAEILKEGAQFEQALQFHKRALDILRSSLLPDHPDIATTLNNIGSIYLHMDDRAKALIFYEEALDIQMRSKAKDIDLASTFNNIGFVCMANGDASSALMHFHTALAIYRRSLPSQHSFIATALSNVADALRMTGRYAEALDYFEQALSIECLSNHIRGMTYNSIAGLYRTLQQTAKALEHYLLALELLNEHLASDHPDVAKVYTNLSTIYSDLGDENHALDYGKRAHAILSATLPSNHYDLAVSHNNLAMILARNGQFRLAIEHNRQAIRIAWTQNHFKLFVTCQLNRLTILEEFSL